MTAQTEKAKDNIAAIEEVAADEDAQNATEEAAAAAAKNNMREAEGKKMFLEATELILTTKAQQEAEIALFSVGSATSSELTERERALVEFKSKDLLQKVAILLLDVVKLLIVIVYAGLIQLKA